MQREVVSVERTVNLLYSGTDDSLVSIMASALGRFNLRLLPTLKRFAGILLASVCMATCLGCKPAPELEVTISPPKVTIPDNSKRGTQLATVSVRWSDGAVFTGDVRLTKNPSGICQLSRIAERGNSLTAATRMELQLGRDTTKADDYTIPVCTVTAFKEGDGH